MQYCSFSSDILKDIYLKDDIEKKVILLKLISIMIKLEIRQYGLMIGIEFTKESGISASYCR